MKRSEMINQIAYVLANYHPVNLEDSNHVAERILDNIESHGMKPPAYFDKEYYDEPECDGYINEWEQE